MRLIEPAVAALQRCRRFRVQDDERLTFELLRVERREGDRPLARRVLETRQQSLRHA